MIPVYIDSSLPPSPLLIETTVYILQHQHHQYHHQHQLHHQHHHDCYQHQLHLLLTYHEETTITRLEMVQQEGKTIHCGRLLITVLEEPGHQHRSIEGSFFRTSLSDRLLLPS
jgi:hypothetical protein